MRRFWPLGLLFCSRTPYEGEKSISASFVADEHQMKSRHHSYWTTTVPCQFKQTLCIHASMLVCCIFLFAGLSCTSDPGERFGSQTELGRFEACDGQLSINIEPGTQRVAMDDDGCSVSLWASAPTPSLVLDNTQPSPLDVRVSLYNAFSSGVLVPEVDAAPFGPECAVNVEESFELGATVSAEDSGVESVIDFRLPPCTRTTVTLVPPEVLGAANGDELRVAVIGEILGNEMTRDRALEEIVSWPADVVVLLGNIVQNPDRTLLEEWRGHFADTGIPVVATLGSEEAQGGALIPFHEVFGRSDFSFVVGDVRFLIIDTASGRLSEEQVSYWERVLNLSTEPIVLAFMSVPPFDPAGGRDYGFLVPEEAERFVSLLAAGGTTSVFTGGMGTYQNGVADGIIIHSTGGGGGPLDALSDFGHHFLKVTVVPGAANPIRVEIQTL